MPQIGKYLLVTAVAVFLSFLLHEFSHYVAGEWLGNSMAFTMNSTYPLAGSFKQDWHNTVVSAAGPAFTIMQGLLFYFLLKRRNNYYLYPFLFTAFFMRFSAMIISFFNPNDEARISTDLGFGKFILPLIVSGFLFVLVNSISKKYKYSRRLQLFTLLFTIICYSAVILLDQRFKIRVL